jgi:hypothetical protein
MAWCEANGVDDIFGLGGNEVLDRQVDVAADDVRVRYAEGEAPVLRLLLHTAAYWLMLTLRDAIPRPRPLANAEFTTPRLRLIKIAARVIETATRVRIAFAASCPQAGLFGGIARWFQPAAP